jgi:integrase/recombinase XerD
MPRGEIEAGPGVKPPPVDEPLELPLEAEEFLVWLSAERGRARNTIAAYRRDLLRYSEWLAGRSTDPLGASADDVVAWIGAQRDDGAAASSIARRHCVPS